MAFAAGMEQAKSILPRLLHHGTPVFTNLELIQGYWQEAVGPLLAVRSAPVRLAGGWLAVDVEGLPWLELMTPMRSQIVECLRSELPDIVVRGIRFRLKEPA